MPSLSTPDSVFFLTMFLTSVRALGCSGASKQRICGEEKGRGRGRGENRRRGKGKGGGGGVRMGGGGREREEVKRKGGRGRGKGEKERERLCEKGKVKRHY